MKTKLMALEALKLALPHINPKAIDGVRVEAEPIADCYVNTIVSATIAAIEADIAKPSEPVAFLLLPGFDGEEFSDAFQVEIVTKEAEKLQEALVKFSDQDGVTIPLYTTQQEPAAADLLKALQDLLDDDAKEYIPSKKWDAARVAIAKATGATP